MVMFCTAKTDYDLRGTDADKSFNHYPLPLPVMGGFARHSRPCDTCVAGQKVGSMEGYVKFSSYINLKK